MFWVGAKEVQDVVVERGAVVGGERYALWVEGESREIGAYVLLSIDRMVGVVACLPAFAQDSTGAFPRAAERRRDLDATG